MTSRSNRTALLAAMVLVVLAAGTAFATRSRPVPHVPAQVTTNHEDGADDGGPPTAEDLAHAADRLEGTGITIDDALLTDLAARYGVGGAVRLYAWHDETGESLVDLAAMRDGMGWGRIARELGVHPGVGSIMGNGGGHGRDTAPGQQKDRGSDE